MKRRTAQRTIERFDYSRLRAVRGLLVVLAVVLLAGAEVGTSSGNAVAAVTQPMRPDAVGFWNQSRGLVGLGNDTYENTPGAIELTTDGGRSFTKVLDTDGAVIWIDTAGAEDAWAVVQANVEDRFTFHSSDGGETWQELPFNQAVSPSFDSATHGFAFAGINGDFDPRRFVVSADGGVSWQRADGPCKPEEAFVADASAKKVWALCLYDAAVSNQEKAVYASVDGGHSWRRKVNVHIFKCSHGLCSLGYPTSVSFSPEGLGFISQDDFGGYISRDGGKRWKLLRKVGEAVSAGMLSRRSGYVLTYRDRRAVLLETSDAGHSFRGVHSWPMP